MSAPAIASAAGLDDPRTLAAWCIERQRQQGEIGYEALHRAVVGAGCAAASALHHGRDEDARRWAHAHDLLSTRSIRVLLTRPRREAPVTDPAHTVLPDDAALPIMVAVPEHAAEVRGVDHPAVVGAVEAAALRASRSLWERAGLSPTLAAGLELEHAFFSSLMALDDDVVVRRADLPEVRREGDRLVCGAVSWPIALAAKHRDALRFDALQNLALHAYLGDHAVADSAPVDDTAPASASDLDDVVCSCTPLVGDRHARGCELYDGWAE